MSIDAQMERVKPYRPHKHVGRSEHDELAAQVIGKAQEFQRRLRELDGFRSTIDLSRAPHCKGVDPQKVASQTCHLTRKLERMLEAASEDT